nr:DUF4091 domain-containing protein [Kibdelosporangium sp. MJ126-NF4]CEL23165.1 Neuraminidase NanP [Kibdelosporangium sp. MJ126-NF4]CTQ90302.1 Neuraminidase NanP [Kibdelosporangium sp. MJ126-NF4]
MRRKLPIILTILLSGMLLAGVHPVSAAFAGITSWTEGPYRKVYQDDTRPGGASTGVVWDAVRNESQSSQLLLRSDTGFTVTAVRFTGLSGPRRIAAASLSYHFQDYYRPTANGPHEPDPLSNDTSRTVAANSTQGVWITVSVPKGQAAGAYSGSVDVVTSAGTVTFPIALTVHAAEIPDTIDSEYNYGTWNTLFNDYADVDGSIIGDDIKNQYGYQRYSPQWWTLIGNVAREMKAQRQNQVSMSLDTLADAGTRLDGQTYTFNWTIFDRFLQTFVDQGAVRTFRGPALVNAGPVEGGTGQVWTIDSAGKVAQEPVGSVAANRWLDQYLPALKAHLDAKGWTARWFQTVSDEPSNPDNFAAVTQKYRAAFGSISTIQEAINGNSTAYVGNVDIWVPSVQEHASAPDWYAGRQALGEEVWSYTCGYCAPPEDGWLDRMSSQPYYTAMEISWGNYHFGLTGFFHWGYNAWAEGGYGNPDGEARPGDGYIVYPDPAHNTVRSSVRGLSTRDGLEDYELFRILGKSDPGKADAIAASLVPAFDRFSDDIDLMTRQAKELRVAAASRK